MSDILIENDSTTEFLVAQLQAQIDCILAVKDGHRIMVYRSEASLPENLVFIDTRIHELTNKTEYRYRSSATNELFVFFKPLRSTSSITPKIIPRISSIQEIDKLSIKIGDIIEPENQETPVESIEKILIL